VIVDSSQAATAVLMLDSVEDDVVVKASEAIYKFSEKCEFLVEALFYKCPHC
jgi:uncharacterized protein (UPF0212 family)